MFADFLLQHNLSKKSRLVRNGIIMTMAIKKEDNKNMVDTGVYVMRYLETFMGETSTWQCDVSTTSVNEINLMRVKYCAAIIGFEYNTERGTLISEAMKYYNARCADPNFNAESILLC